MLGRTDNNPDALLAQLREVVNTDLSAEDGLIFDGDSFEAETITEDADYEGLRIRGRTELNGARVRLQLDIGFGDTVVPEPQLMRYPMPLAPEPCATCGQQPCICAIEPPRPCPVCGERPCRCEKEPPEPCEVCGEHPCVCEKRRKVKVKLADGKERTIQHMSATSFWSPDGKPISAAEFVQRLFGELPTLFADEDELRTVWGRPDTRRKLLEGLEEKGYGVDQLREVSKLIKAENSDLYDVLAYIAFN